MAASGGFWAKGTFFSPVEQMVMGGISKATESYLPAGTIKGDKGVAAWNILDPEGLVVDYLNNPENMPAGVTVSQLQYAMNQAKKDYPDLAASAGYGKKDDVVTAEELTAIQAEIAAGNSATAQVAAQTEETFGGLTKAELEAAGIFLPDKPVDLTPSFTADVDFTKMSNNQAANWGMSEYQQWSNSLSSNEKHAIGRYTTPYYHKVRAQLSEKGYNPDAFPNSEMTKVISGLDTALAKATVKQNMITFRGATGKRYQGLGVGDVIEDTGFTSTSVSKTYAGNWAAGHTFRGPPAFLEVQVKKGQKGAYIGATSSAGNAEYEFLLPRNGSYKVISVSSITFKGKSMPHYVVEMTQAGE